MAMSSPRYVSRTGSGGPPGRRAPLRTAVTCAAESSMPGMNCRAARAGAADVPRRAHRHLRAGRRRPRPQAARQALMRVVTDLADLEPRPRALAIGTFDGVHVGHRAVIG